MNGKNMPRNDTPVMDSSARHFSTGELTTRLGGTLDGDPDVPVRGINAIDEAGPDEITYIISSRFAAQWRSSGAGAVLVSECVDLEDDEGTPRPRIIVPRADLAAAQVLEWFAPRESQPEEGVSEHAVVHESVRLGTGVRIGDHVWIDRDTEIGNDVVLFPGARVYAGCRIGDRTCVHANTVIRERSILGADVILHQNVSIGSDGFGFKPSSDGASIIKLQHVGHVRIEEKVEIGAGSCVDRGTFGATIIGRDTKVDNLCQIGHNVKIGCCCIIAGCSGIGGSTVLGDRVMVGGMCTIIDHLQVGDGASFGSRSLVLQDVPAGETWTGHPAGPMKGVLRQWAAIKKLAGRK